MKIFNILSKTVTLLIIIISLASCKEDFVGVGSNIIGDQTLYDSVVDNNTVIAFSRKLVPVQTNNLPIYQLGIYNDPVYGKQTANLVSQIKLLQIQPTFGDSAQVEKVTLYIPYFSKATVSADTTTYTLDSVYGSSPINIHIYESNYFLRDFDPNSDFQELQKYYSNQGPTFNSYIGPELAFVENFVPTNEGFIENPGADNEVKIPPGLRTELSKDFFQEKIIGKEGQPELINNNNFVNYFRGLNFQVTSTEDNGSLFYFDIAKAEIEMEYSFKNETTSERDTTSLKLNFSGINVNTFTNTLPQEIQTAITVPNVEDGEADLYLKGSDGIISIINLFGPDSDENGLADELEDLRRKKWLINEANLIFYVDRDKVTGGASEPERIIIYDLKNNTILADFPLDITSGLEAEDAVTIHLGKLHRDADGNGEYYKIRITNHISNLINNAAENVPLGIIVTQNVLATRFQSLENAQSPGITGVPVGSVISHEGTVLFGNAAPDPTKRLKLQIYYTEPN